MSLSIFLIIVIIGFIIGGAVGFILHRKTDIVLARIIDHIMTKYIDERTFTAERISKELGIDEKVVKEKLAILEELGLVHHEPKRGYVLVDPLVFLTSRDYLKALRITANDNILYGGYQYYYLANPIYFIIQLAILISAFLFVVMTFFNIYSIKTTLINILPSQVSPESFALFILALAIIVTDALNNVIKILAREKYSVIVGEKSGISYNRRIGDEFGGNIPRYAIDRIDYDVSLWYKIYNLFGSIPVGNIKVYVKGSKTPVIFRAMPFPRELYNIIKSIKLGALQWRKRYARTIALWRTGVFPVEETRRRRRR
ncbi:MAG: hypothetical protein ACTSX9_07520 [Candidatus Njordarchaeales archaeon]